MPTSAKNLLIGVRLHDGRYHGDGEWLPSPARVFQALVAGAGQDLTSQGVGEAFEWLEALAAPTLAIPIMQKGQRVETFVPDNDLDAVDGDPGRVDEIRSLKVLKPKLLDAEQPFLFFWEIDTSVTHATGHAAAICAVAERLYQFGRGIDMAWAWAELIDRDQADERQAKYQGSIFRPSKAGTGKPLPCPAPGSLESLRARFTAGAHRFGREGEGKTSRLLFSQPPKARFAQVHYESPPSRMVYELREDAAEAAFGVWPLRDASALVVWARDGAADQLRAAFPGRYEVIERVMIGRKANGADEGPASGRVKIVPLPSIGHQHADRGIRRLLIEVPSGCALRPDDVHWAFSRLPLSDPATGEVTNLILTPAADNNMLAHYGTGDLAARTWRTVTPATLPQAARRRIEPARRAEGKGGTERSTEEAMAGAAVILALRHADIRAHVESVRVQREPFEAAGERAEAFAPGTRFARDRLWHVELSFDSPVAGPLVIGDGRFLGLGVMAPVKRAVGVHALAFMGGPDNDFHAEDVARALRRAVMSRAQRVIGDRDDLPAFFSGHEADGAPARTEHSPHLTFACDAERGRLLVIAPHVIERRPPTHAEAGHLEVLDAAMTGFRELRSGSAGLLRLQPIPFDAGSDRLFAASRVWECVTEYQVTRHAKRVGADEAIAADVRDECRRAGLPEPRVTPRLVRGIPRVGVSGGVRIDFQVAVNGPIALGRTRFLGGGLFVGAPACE